MSGAVVLPANIKRSALPVDIVCSGNVRLVRLLGFSHSSQQSGSTGERLRTTSSRAPIHRSCPYIGKLQRHRFTHSRRRRSDFDRRRLDSRGKTLRIERPIVDGKVTLGPLLLIDSIRLRREVLLTDVARDDRERINVILSVCRC